MADVTRRSRAAQLLAFFALVAALVGALGPAEKRTTTYDWPPATLPSGKPSSAWYTPLLLTRHRAEAVSASIPCRLPPALPGASGSTILATARFPERTDALAVTNERSRLVVRIGGREIVRTPLAAASSVSDECAYRLSLAGGRWALDGGPGALAESGALLSMPVVTGLFSELDLGTGEAPTIRVTTPVQGGKPRPHQKVAWVLAALAVAAALALVAFPRRPRPWRALRRGTRSALGALRFADAVVVGALLAWWVLSPAFHDDGWIVARQRTFASSGGFASYYNAFGVHYPGAYWLEWAQHWLVESTSALVLLRVPALLCLLATWVLARWILARLVPASTTHERVALWTLSTGFLVGAFAWGMTLRPEPVSALLVTAALACIVRFRERGTTAPLAALAVVLPFALTGHQAAVDGICAVARRRSEPRSLGSRAHRRSVGDLRFRVCAVRRAPLRRLRSRAAERGRADTGGVHRCELANRDPPLHVAGRLPVRNTTQARLRRRGAPRGRRLSPTAQPQVTAAPRSSGCVARSLRASADRDPDQVPVALRRSDRRRRGRPRGGDRSPPRGVPVRAGLGGQAADRHRRCRGRRGMGMDSTHRLEHARPRGRSTGSPRSSRGYRSRPLPPCCRSPSSWFSLWPGSFAIGRPRLVRPGAPFPGSSRSSPFHSWCLRSPCSLPMRSGRARGPSPGRTWAP